MTTLTITFGWLPRFRISRRFPFVHRDRLHVWLVPLLLDEWRRTEITVDFSRRPD